MCINLFAMQKIKKNVCMCAHIERKEAKKLQFSLDAEYATYEFYNTKHSSSLDGILYTRNIATIFFFKALGQPIHVQKYKLKHTFYIYVHLRSQTLKRSRCVTTVHIHRARAVGVAGIKPA